jgi:hypothetical protein
MNIVRLSMTVNLPADVRPGEFAERLHKHIDAGAGYSVQSVACIPQNRREDKRVRREKEKQEFIATWLAAHGREPGVDTREDVLKMIADDAFRVLELPEEMRVDGVHIDRVWHDDPGEFISDPGEFISAAWKKMRGAIKVDSTVKFFRLTDGRFGADVILKWGPFQFERLVELKPEYNEQDPRRVGSAAGPTSAPLEGA